MILSCIVAAGLVLGAVPRTALIVSLTFSPHANLCEGLGGKVRTVRGERWGRSHDKYYPGWDQIPPLLDNFDITLCSAQIFARCYQTSAQLVFCWKFSQRRTQKSLTSAGLSWAVLRRGEESWVCQCDGRPLGSQHTETRGQLSEYCSLGDVMQG